MTIIFDMKTRNSVALVTGANRGLGLAFAKELLARGATKVYAAVRDPKSVPSIPGLVPVELDVTKPDTIARLGAAAPDVTLVINNAGVYRGQGALAPDAVAAARAEIETNYIGPLAVSSALAPALGKNGGGAIVNVLSALSWVSLGTSATYSASKAAAWQLTNGLRNELPGTQVVGVHVGYIDTDMAKSVSAAKVTPEFVVSTTLDALEKGATEVLVDGTAQAVKANLTNGVYLQPVSV